MTIRQLSVYVENKAGRFKEITGILTSASINIIAHALLDTRDFGVLRMIVDTPERAVDILKTQGFVVNLNHVLGVLVDDRPGGFDQLLAVLAKKKISFNYTYSIGQLDTKKAVIILHVDDRETAERLLRGQQVEMVGHDTLCQSSLSR